MKQALHGRPITPNGVHVKGESKPLKLKLLTVYYLLYSLFTEPKELEDGKLSQ